MHDPMTVAFVIRWPWSCRSLVTIWHRDRGGVDGACDWTGSHLSPEEREQVRMRAAYLDDERIDGAVVGWALAKSHFRPWYRHPQWHLHHWRLQVHPWQRLRRAFQRCAVCHERFGLGNPVLLADWGGDRLRHLACDRAGARQWERCGAEWADGLECQRATGHEGPHHTETWSHEFTLD